MMKTIARCLGVVLLPVIAFTLSFVALVAASAYLETAPPQIPRPYLTLYFAFVLGSPLVAAFALAYRLRGWLPGFIANSRAIRVILIVGYLVTAFFGVPAAQTHSNEWAVAEYKSIVKDADQNRVWDSHPYIATYAAIPILPCVILTYDEYQLAGLYGLGSFNVYLWYGSGVKTLHGLPLWIS